MKVYMDSVCLAARPEPHLFKDEVLCDALESGMGLLLEHKDDVSGQQVGITAASLAPEHHLGVVLVPLLYVHLKHLLLCHQALQAHAYSAVAHELLQMVSIWR